MDMGAADAMSQFEPCCRESSMNAKRAYPKPASLKRPKPVLDPSSTSARRAQEIRDLFERSEEKTLAILPQAKVEVDEEKTIPLSPIAHKHQERANHGEDTRLIAPPRRPSKAQRPEDAVVSNEAYKPAVRINGPQSDLDGGHASDVYDATTRVQVLGKNADALAKQGDVEESKWPSLVLWTLVAIAIVGLYFWQSPQGVPQKLAEIGGQRPGEISVPESRERVSFYRSHLGNVLNRQRVDVELENFNKSPITALDVSTRETTRPMLGVPLTQEGQPTIDRGQLVPVSPDHPDARIQYSLQEEADREAWTKKANDQYVKDFLANARAQGLDVILDKDLNVIEVRPYRPGTSGPSRGGVSR